ncbi:MAG TPA: hypothetical protein PLX26_07985 [Candidatus Competibacteraceae bacterium]|nr:hypothetical protein [Candidatus Competibacteraceae bacterium]
MKISYAPLVFLCLGLGACMSPIPIQTSYPTTYQREMLAVHHWDVMATDVANWLQNLLMGTPTDEQGQAKPRNAQPIVLNVQQPQYNSEASSVFHSLLLTQLVNRGFVIGTNSSEGLPVTYDIKTVTEPVMLAETDNSEVVINASVMSGGSYVGRFSDIYYIPHPNLGLYIAQGPAPTTRMMEVVGP